MDLSSQQRWYLGLGAAGLAWLTYRTLIHRPFSFRGRNVLVTGGARGLGLEIARLLVAEGARVAICSRTASQIERAVDELRDRGGIATGMVCDVADPVAVRQFVEAAAESLGPVDVIINNAGIIQVGPLAAMTLADFRQAMDVHFWGPLHVLHAALPHLRGDRQGRIANIASIGGKISVPHLLPYCASKFALVGLSQGLQSELASKGISITTVCPGLMRTGSPRNALFKGQHRAEYAWFSIGASLPGLSTDSTTAARSILDAVRRRQSFLTFGAAAKVAILLHDLFPNLSAAQLDLVNWLLPAPDAQRNLMSHKGSESESAWSPSVLTSLNETAAARNNEMEEPAPF